MKFTPDTIIKVGRTWQDPQKEIPATLLKNRKHGSQEQSRSFE